VPPRLQAPQFGDELRRQQVVAGGQQLTDLDEGDACLLQGPAQRPGHGDVLLVITQARPHPDLPDQPAAGRDGTDLGISAGTRHAVLGVPYPGGRRAPGQDGVDDQQRQHGRQQLNTDHHREQGGRFRAGLQVRPYQAAADGQAEHGAQQRADQTALQPKQPAGDQCEHQYDDEGTQQGERGQVAR
jgi:hypothetical protein